MNWKSFVVTEEDFYTAAGKVLLLQKSREVYCHGQECVVGMVCSRELDMPVYAGCVSLFEGVRKEQRIAALPLVAQDLITAFDRYVYQDETPKITFPVEFKVCLEVPNDQG